MHFSRFTDFSLQGFSRRAIADYFARPVGKAPQEAAKTKTAIHVSGRRFNLPGRGERIRTSDLSVPNRAHYQAVLRPEAFLDRERPRAFYEALLLVVKFDPIKDLASGASFPLQARGGLFFA